MHGQRCLGPEFLVHELAREHTPIVAHMAHIITGGLEQMQGLLWQACKSPLRWSHG